MLFKSQVYTQASGSVGGLTYARNAGGMYTRARSVPVQPNTSFQAAVRNVLAALASAWTTALTSAQRDSWAVYAANSPVTNRLGDPLVLSGQQMYLRCNTPRVQAGLTRFDDGPVAFGLVDLGTLTVVASEATQDFSVTIADTPAWAGTTDGFLGVYTSRPMNVSRNYFKGPYRLAGRVDGDGVTPVTSGTVTSPFALVQGQRVALRARASNADGRLSPQFTTSLIVGA